MSLSLQVYHHLPAPARSAAASLRGLYLSMWRYGRVTERLVAEAREREHWSTEQWKTWRDERLAYVLHRAATKVPYYREQWMARRRHGDHASWELIENWPLLEKEAVRKNAKAFVAEDCNLRRMLHEQTSGTTGTPLDLWRSRRTVQSLYALSLVRARGWYGLSRREPRAMLGGQRVISFDRRRPPFWVWNAGMRQLYMSSYHLSRALIPYYLDALARYRCVYLEGYTSSLHALAEEAVRLGRSDLKMRVAITCAEPVSAQQRETIARAFQCPVQETYGMGENVSAASECGAGRLHQWPEVGLIEVFNGTEPAADGTSGEFICTGLLNPDMPFIRYRVGDRGRLEGESQPCGCGRTLPQIGSIEGRTTDLLLTREGRPVFWLNPVFYGLPVRQAQIVQETLDRVRVRYAPASDFRDATGRTIIERLRTRMGEVEVLLEEVEELPRTANGKMRSVICNLTAAEREAVLRSG